MYGVGKTGAVTGSVVHIGANNDSSPYCKQNRMRLEAQLNCEKEINLLAIYLAIINPSTSYHEKVAILGLIYFHTVNPC